VSAVAVKEMVRGLDSSVAVSAFGGLGALARDALLRERMLFEISPYDPVTIVLAIAARAHPGPGPSRTTRSAVDSSSPW
jgi:hypothetical protein